MSENPRAHGGRRVAPLPDDWPQRRAAVLERCGYRCEIEGCPRPARDVDHIISAADGGGDELGNLQGLCIPHHLSKTGREAARARARRFSRFREEEPHPGTVTE